ncbi:RNA-binding protein 48 [Onthophagus taurus]|uniref:RNA-binding protein 48 n=1 Tax=Onthophagus taurus TaxID=166361 RepID=UPI0039BEB12E
METKLLKDEYHHKQRALCKTRPVYRQGRKLTAVKTYTVNNESQHLFIYGVPQINLRNELKALCRKYGEILSIHITNEYKTEAFTECYHVRYERIQSARIAKRFLDNRSFYGGILHVCYGPEHENVVETRTKLMQRFKDVLCRVGFGYQNNNERKTVFQKENFKRKFDDTHKIQKDSNNFKTFPKKFKNDAKKTCFIPTSVVRANIDNKLITERVIYKNTNSKTLCRFNSGK